MYGYKCEYCDGTVEERVIKQEASIRSQGVVILEKAPVGVCNKCGNRYYHSTLLRRVDEIATKRRAPDRMESVPVVTFR